MEFCMGVCMGAFAFTDSDLHDTENTGNIVPFENTTPINQNE